MSSSRWTVAHAPRVAQETDRARIARLGDADVPAPASQLLTLEADDSTAAIGAARARIPDGNVLLWVRAAD